MRLLATLLCAGTLGCAAQAQQNTMPDMPGMNMPAAPKPAPKQPPQNPKRPALGRTPVNPAAPAPRSVGKDADNSHSQGAAVSPQNSTGQQAAPPASKPTDGSDAQSLTLPIQSMQEPEAESFRTGTDLPAPDLLAEVVGRSPMHLEDFLALAEANNPTLAQAERNLQRSREQARQAGLPPDPTLGYSGDHIRGGEYHGGEEGAFFSQVFVLGRKLALRRDTYRAEGRANEFAIEVQRARVRNDVGLAFVDALAAQQSVDLHDRLLKVALDAETNSHELQRVGQADASAVLMAEIEAEKAKVDFSHAQRDFLASFATLATLCGKGDLSARPLTGALTEPPQLDTATLVANDATDSPMVRQAQANVDAAQTRLKEARRESVPNLNLTAGEWYSGEELSRVNKSAGWESFVQAGVQIPLWNHNQGNIAAAQAILARSQKDVDRTRLWTRNRAEPLAQEYSQARFTADRYRTEMIPRARRAYQLETLKYQQMAQQYPAVLTAQGMLFTLQLGYVEALHTEWRSAIELENYTLQGALETPQSEGTDNTTQNLPTSSGGN